MRGKSRGVEFCCCAIPLINFGSYTICLEFIFVALCVALLAVGPPSIVAGQGGALPSGWPKFIVCILGIVIVLWQILGLISIKRESTGLYRTYIRINFLLTLATILVTLAFFAIAAARHSTALTSCVALYGNTPAGSTTAASQLASVGNDICNIFLWVQVGFMGLLIAVIGLTQLYMCLCQRAYGQEMRKATQEHKAYNGNAEGIPLANRGSGIWEADTVPASLPPKEHQQRNFAPGYEGRHHNSDDMYGGQEDLDGPRAGAGYGQSHANTAPYQSYQSYDQQAPPGSYESYEQPNNYAYQQGQQPHDSSAAPPSAMRY